MAAERENGLSGSKAFRTGAGFRHEAMLYEGEEGFLAGTLPFVRGAAERGEPLLVAVDADKIDLLRGRLGGTPDSVRFADMRQIGVNPGRIISAWRDFVDEHAPSGAPLRGIGEPVWAERDADELLECHRHECLLNAAFADAPDFHLICPYDTAALDPEAVGLARESHPIVVSDGTERASDRYLGLEGVPSLLAEPLEDPPAGAEACRFDADALSALRRLVTAHALDSGLDELRVEAAMLAVNELATNSVRHAGGGGTLRWWRTDGALVWEVSDAGRIVDPLVGRGRPADGRNGGYGLWMVNELSDLVQLRTSERGTVVRMHLRAPA